MMMLEATPLMIPAIAPDGSLFPIEKLAAHESGALHQAVSVFVFDGQDLLIQRRAMSKYHCGGTWANSCCTHPHWGESLADSAHRRLREEMGFDIELTPASQLDYRADVTNGLVEHERVQVYFAMVSRAQIEVCLNLAEVDDFAWMNIADLKMNAIANTDLYAPWFRIYLSRWAELGLPVG